MIGGNTNYGGPGLSQPMSSAGTYPQTFQSYPQGPSGVYPPPSGVYPPPSYPPTKQPRSLSLPRPQQGYMGPEVTIDTPFTYPTTSTENTMPPPPAYNDIAP